MKCTSCQSWTTADGKTGTCSHLAMRFHFTPYSDPAAERLGFNRDGLTIQPMPRTDHDYSCEHWS